MVALKTGRSRDGNYKQRMALIDKNEKKGALTGIFKFFHSDCHSTLNILYGEEIDYLNKGDFLKETP